jgi:hypothetical protein
MFPPIVGLGIFLLAVGLAGLGLIAAAIALFTGRPVLLRNGLLALGTVVAAYLAVWTIGLVSAPRRVVPVGEEIHFCGVDCHLHVSVVKATRGTDVGVIVRFRSDARRADEFPYLLSYTIVDQDGRRYLPSGGVMSAPLKAGETVEQEIRFSVPADASQPRLVISYDSFMDYLIAGRANPLVQRRTRLALDS